MNHPLGHDDQAPQLGAYQLPSSWRCPITDEWYQADHQVAAPGVVRTSCPHCGRTHRHILRPAGIIQAVKLASTINVAKTPAAWTWRGN